MVGEGMVVKLKMQQTPKNIKMIWMVFGGVVRVRSELDAQENVKVTRTTRKMLT